MNALVLRACGTWFALLLLAILNAFLREKLVVPFLGSDVAAPLSAVTLSLLIFFAAMVIVPVFGPLRSRHYWLIGLVWLVMTVVFEFLFGHYVAGQSWEELLEAYEFWNGQAWVLVLLATLVSPYLAAR